MSRQPAPGLTPEQASAVRSALAANPNEMTMQLAGRLGVPEAEVIRLLPAVRAADLDPARWEEIFRALEPLGDVHVIVSNGAVTCEVVGAFGGFSTTGEFFNVQSGSLDLHVRWRRLAAAFAVEKPGHLDAADPAGPDAKRRATLSVQFYDPDGAAALKVFLHFSGLCPPARREAFEGLKARFRRAAAG